MECASSDTANLLTAPELTRLTASHPCVQFAGIVNKEDVVFAHVAGGSELTLKPGLNIIGGVQPRAFSEPIPCAPDIEPMLEIDAILDSGAILDMGEVEVICIELSVVDISITVISVDMPGPPISILLFIPVMLFEEVSVEI